MLASVLAWLVVVAVLHQRRIARLRRSDVPSFLAPQPNLPSSTLRRVGFFQNRKNTSFIRFGREKSAGKTRVCSFGDSFTQGQETGPTHDYPGHLQRHLDAESPGSFEVLNFGQGWFGFHQTYILWDEVGRDFGCDVVLLGPAGFFPDRDVSFNHARDANPYYLHARYVLDPAEGVRLVDVVGETEEERFGAYHSLFPDPRYLRYDIAPPAFLRALLGDGRTLDNPFYASPDAPEDEAAETYRILLERMQRESPRLIFGGRLRFTKLAAPDTETFRPSRPDSFPYRAPRNHFGPIGNDLIARQYARRVLGRTPSTLPALRTRDLPRDEPPHRRADPPDDLSQFDRVHARLEGQAVGHFVRGRTHHTRAGTPQSLREENVASLLLVGTRPMADTESDGPLDGCFLPLPTAVADGTEVSLEQNGERRRVGVVRLWHPELALGEIVLDGPVARLRQRSSRHGGTFSLPRSVESSEVRSRLLIGSHALLEGTPSLLRSRTPECWLLRANENGWVDVDALPASGLVELVARRPNANALVVPLARWEKTRIAESRSSPGVTRQGPSKSG